MNWGGRDDEREKGDGRERKVSRERGEWKGWMEKIQEEMEMI